MICNYRLRTDVVSDEELFGHTVYGLEAVTSSGSVIVSVPDVSSDFSAVNSLVSLCNSLLLDTVHLFDVIDDYL